MSSTLTAPRTTPRTTPSLDTPLTPNPDLLAWVDECARLTRPDRVVWCDGTEEVFVHADDPFELANVRATPAGTAFAAANAPLTQFLSSCKGDECNRPVPVPATRFACYNVTPPSFPRTLGD